MGMIDHFMEKNFDDSNAVVTLRLDAISKRLPDALRTGWPAARIAKV
jgi:hypothetical protein